MQAVPMPRGRNLLAKSAKAMLVVVLSCSSAAANLRAAEPPVHYLNAGNLTPGAIGSQQLQRGGPLPGYFQPVEIKAPPGALVSTAAAGGFEAPQSAPLLAGMLIGAVYRLRLTNIPGQQGYEVYPTIEVIDRLYPPIGQEFRFPIRIDLSQDELELALQGKFVTRVVYLEEPKASLPMAQSPSDQSVFEVGEGDNPLDVADSLGRPVAIVRLGGRLPGAEGPDEQFLYGSPPMIKWKPAAARQTQVSVSTQDSVQLIRPNSPTPRVMRGATAR